MDEKQTQQEIFYKMSLKMLDGLLRKGIVDDVQYAQIDRLNMESFSPCLATVYV